MKKPLNCLMVLLTTTFLCQAQDKVHPHVIHKNKNGTITSVEFAMSESKSKIPASSTAFFEEYLKVKPSDEFKKVPQRTKKEGYVHEHFDQYFKGIKVDGAGYNFHYKNGQMYFANGRYVVIDGLNATPTLSLKRAVGIFLKYKEIPEEQVLDTVTELLIKGITAPESPDSLTSVELVYKIYLESDHSNNTEVGYVNAHTGEVVGTEPRVIDLLGTLATRYSGSQQADTDPVAGGHRLFDDSRGVNIHTLNLQNNTTTLSNAVEITDNDNNWTAAEHAGNNNDMGLDVHWTLQELYDYLSTAHGINSFDDNNVAINAYVRYGDDNAERDNAGWNPTQNVLMFGQGVSDFRPLASLDVVAHEFGHGITDFQIGWAVSGDERAFHEGMSDIWGAILEQRIRANSAWTIGEQVTLNFPHLRNLQETNHVSAQMKITDTYQSTQYNSGAEYVRSGVFSHWFYILVNGESGFNALGRPYSVDGIGLDDAEAIIVEAVFNNYLDGTTSYPAVRTSIINAAIALFGNCSVQHTATVNAWNAVGVGTATDSPITGKYQYYGGTYLAVGSAGVGVSGCNTSIYVELADYGSSGVYNWSISSQSGTASASFNGNTATMTLGSGGNCVITCQVNTTCGTESFSFTGYNYYCPYGLMAYPNPADETLTISDGVLEKTHSENTLVAESDSEDPVLIELFSEAGLVVASEKLENRKCVLNTKNIPPGQYFLHVGEGRDKVIKHILIEH